jgi:hypothetical protein
MSHSTSMAYLPDSGDGRLRQLWQHLRSAVQHARQRWQDASRVRACHQAIRGLDRRTLQDLGLYAEAEPGWRGIEYERLRG